MSDGWELQRVETVFANKQAQLIIHIRSGPLKWEGELIKKDRWIERENNSKMKFEREKERENWNRDCPSLIQNSSIH